MDPRARRSRDRLTKAVLSFAEKGRLDDVTVSELAREADVTRDTFYRHATSVTDLLTVAIRELLEEFGAAYAAELPARSELATVLRESEPALLHHIKEHANVYRTALSGPNASPAYRALVDFLGCSLLSVILHAWSINFSAGIRSVSIAGGFRYLILPGVAFLTFERPSIIALHPVTSRECRL